MAAWALINLILAVLGIAFVVVTISRMRLQKKREENQEAEYTFSI